MKLPSIQLTNLPLALGLGLGLGSGFWNSLAFLLSLLGEVGAVVELAFEELDADDGEDEHEEEVDDGDVGDVFDGVHHAVKDGLDAGEDSKFNPFISKSVLK